ncbi:MAG: hypothetical protein AB1640_21110 [bacterium]
MDPARASEIVLRCLREYLEAHDIPVTPSEETILLGKESVIDSMGLVNLIIDIESTLLDAGLEVSLTSESAMSRSRSPFRTVRTLAEFISSSVGAADA